jgi:hypothetical protein
MMSDENNSRRIYLGTYEGGTTALVIPAPVLTRANEALDAERAKREAEAERKKLRIAQDVQSNRKLRRVLHALLGRGRRR